MNIKVLFLITFITLQVFCLEITLSPSKRKETTKEEIQIYLNNLQRKGIIIKDKEKVKKRIIEDRILADKYIQNQTTPSRIIISYKHQLEQELADLYIRKKMEKKISNKEIKSYYIMHRNQFKEPKKLSLILYDFKDYNEAVKAYQKKNFYGYKPKKIKISINKIVSYLRPIFYKLKKGDITPPIYFRGKFIIFKVENIENSKIKPLQKVENEIRKILLKKAYTTYRKQVLEKIKK